jgi:TRAP-type C4-dicarboxylate transport system permease small subunit
LPQISEELEAEALLTQMPLVSAEDGMDEDAHAAWEGHIEPQFEALPDWLRALDRGLVYLTEWALVVIGLLFTLLIVLEVASRYFFGFSLFFVNAAAKFLLLWFFLLGAGAALRFSAHIGFELIVQSLSPRLGRIVRVSAQLLALVFFAQMIWAGLLSLGPATMERDSALNVSLVWGFLAVPVGFALLTYHMIILMIVDLRTAGERPS